MLQEMILSVTQKWFVSRDGEDALRSMIAHTMTLRWLILGALAGKYASADDDIAAEDLLDF